MLEAVKVALDPTPRQERLLESHAGGARFAYNAGLAHVKNVLKESGKPEWSYYALRRWWNANKDGLAVNADTGEPWWRENSKEAYNAGLESLADALSNWSRSRKGLRKGRRVGFPRFKSKDRATPRFAYTTGSFGLIDGDPHALRLPRIGRVHCMENIAKRVGDAKVMRMNVSRHGGRWYAGLTVERAGHPVSTPPRGGNVGIDLGVKELATLSDGTVVHNPRALDSNLKRLRRAQKDMSRKARGSNRRRKARTRVARLHARVADLRCGTVKAKLSLSERVYHCEKCGLVIDRDVNAAINIRVAGSAPETLNARGGSGRRTDASRRATRHPVKREPSDGVSRVRLGAGLGNEVMQVTSL